MYAKIFTSIFDGSMRGHSDLILVFVNILCHVDHDGFSDRHWQAISDETGLSVKRVKEAITELEGPDKQSRSQNDDGRRLKRINPDRDWGWEVVNFKKYDGIRSTMERREYMRNFMADKRKEKMLAGVSNALAPVSNVSLLDTDTDTDTEEEKIAGNTEPPRLASRIKLCTPDWIESLRPDCKKQGIDLDEQIIKAKRWISGNPGRRFTQRFLINWLNRCDKTISVGTQTPTSPAPLSVFALKERIRILESERERTRNSFNFQNNPEAKKKASEITTAIKEAEKKILEITK